MNEGRGTAPTHAGRPARPGPSSWIPHLAAAILVGGIYLGGGLGFLESRLTDLRFRLLHRPAADRTVVVAIDPRSLAALPHWPWPRGYHATVLENLLAAGAERVAFDLDFSSRSIAEEDAALRDALASARGRVILPVFHQWQREGRGESGALVTTQPIAELAEHAILASINIQPELDGLVRRYGDRRGNAPSMAEALTGLSPALPRFHLDYAIDPGTIPRISYVDVLTGQFDRGSVKGKAIIVGATAVELGDQVAVPRYVTLPGPVLQALAVESLADGRDLRSIPVAAILLILLGLGTLAGPALERAPWRRGLLGALGIGTGLAAVALGLQATTPWLLTLSPLLMVLAVSYSLGLVRRLDRQGLRLLLQAARVRKTETMMRQVVQNSLEGIVTLDAEGDIQTCNPAAETLFDRAEQNVCGLPFTSLVPSGLPGPSRAIEGSTNRNPGPVETIGLRRGDVRFPLELTITEFPLEGNLRRVAFLRDITERKAQAEALEYQATHDALTDLPNRVLLLTRLERLLERAREDGASLAVLILDLDRFKEINDTLGHQMGDLLLRQIARRLQTPLGGDDTIARLGGDEFAILLPACTVEQATQVAKRLTETLQTPFRLQGLTLQVDMSIGVAMFPEHGTQSSTLLQRGDVAMYVAKESRHAVSVYNAEEDFNSVRHLTLKGELGQAVEEGHLTLFYQPKICARSGRIAGVEALVRWLHPTHGMVYPNEFIPLAEHTGLIKPITQWVLRTGLRQCAAWEHSRISLPLSVNCSARNLLEEDLPRTIEENLRAVGLPAERLILEITETAIIEDPPRALEVVTVLARMGVRISIDDFGTGYSSLDYLKKLPATELKIDKSFVMGMDEDEGNAAIVRSTVDLAHNLGLQAVAEGVDSPAVWNRLQMLGCDLGQGYLFSRPVAAEDLSRWIATSAWGLPVTSLTLAAGSASS